MKRSDFRPSMVNRIPFELLLLVFIALVQLAVILKMGPFISADSNTHIRWSDAMLAHNFNLPKYFEATQNWVGGANKLYLNHILFLSVIRLIFGQHWQFAFLAVNVVCQTATAFCLIRTIKLVSPSRILSIVSLSLYCLAFDAFMWSRYLLSDSIFLFLNFLAFHYVVKVFVAQDQNSGQNLLILAATTLIATFYRPHGLMTFLFVFFAGFASLFLKKVSSALAFISFLTVLLMAFAVHAFILFHYGEWESLPFRAWIDFNAQFYRLGVVVHERPETYLPEPTTSFAFLEITLVRFFTFFQFLPSGWSLSHRLMSAVFFVPVYAAMLISLVEVLRQRVSPERAFVCLIAWFFILGMAGLSAISILDYDWRYRLSLFPLFALVATLGCPWEQLSHQIFLRTAASKSGIGIPRKLGQYLFSSKTKP